MKPLEQKRLRAARRKRRNYFSIRSKGLQPRPRLVFVRSNRYFSVQLIDDEASLVLCHAATNEKSFADKAGKNTKNKQAAQMLGKIIAERAKAKGVTKVTLDRRDKLYHGCVLEFSNAVRKEGLIF